MTQWEMGAPVGTHCCSIDCDFDPQHDEPNLASWTLHNGGWDVYYCDDCYRREVSEGGYYAQHGS